MADPEPNYNIPTLLPIDSPRAEGSLTAPLMRTNFLVPGLMVLQTPRADADGNPPTNPSPVDHGFAVVGSIIAGTLVHDVLVAEVKFENWTIVANVEGLIELDIAVTTDGSNPTAANSICDGNYPAIATTGLRASGATNEFSDVCFPAGARFAVYVRSVTDITSMYFSLTECD